MPILEELFIEGEITSGEEENNEEEEMVIPSLLKEFIWEDDHVVMMEGGYREGGFEEEENDRWEYVNEELIEDGESPVLGVSGYDRVIWACGTPVNMVRV